MKALFGKLVKRWGRRPGPEHAGPLLDLAFYRSRYPDVRALATDKALIAHYRTCGIAEGRFPNAEIELETLLRDGIGPDDPFDLIAYRALNPDLNRLLRGDAEFVAHYIEHGREEGRPCRFPNNDKGVAWQPLFNASQYLARHSGDAAPALIDVRAAFDHFCEHGIDRLEPLNFADGFDPEFYRSHYRIGPSPDDRQLYREWLDSGLMQGRSPNELRLLEPMLCGRAFPAQFDWRAYCADAGLDHTAGRADALVWMFASDEDAARIVRFVRPSGLALLVDICRYRQNRNDYAVCAALLREWGEHEDGADDWPSELWGIAAEIAAYHGDLAKAWNCALAVVDRPDHGFSALERVVAIAAKRAKPRDALDVLERQAARWRGDAPFSALCMTVLEQVFEQDSARAHAILRGADEAAGFDPVMTGCVRRIQDALDRLMLPPARSGPVPDGHIAMLANLDVRQCNHYRVEQKAQWCAAKGIELRIHPENQADAFVPDLVGASAAIFYRVQATPAVLRAILHARAMGLPTYYEIDDLLFDGDAFPPAFESYSGALSAAEYRGLKFSVPLFRAALAACDRAIASTDTLLKAMLPLVRLNAGCVLRNGLDSRSVLARSMPVAANRNVTRIFYGSGTKAHSEDFAEIAGPALARIMHEFAEVELVLVGHVPVPACLTSCADRITAVSAMANVRDYWALLGQCDINLAVLRRGGAEDAKSEIKWLEAAAMGIPSVVSATPSYRERLTDGHDVLMADCADAWYSALRRLVADKRERLELGQRARATALAQFCHEAAFADFYQDLRNTGQVDGASLADSGKLRVLVCNVFFPPQMLGGATRVVAANVEHIAKTCPDITQAVFTSDVWPAQTIHLATSDHEGTPVFRLRLPQDASEEDARTRESVVAHFRQVLHMFQPDIVHFHCIQRLSDAIVAEVLDAGIPYIVTLHDGWWISPHQFLVDQHGFERVGGADPLADRTMPADEAARIVAHRARLYPLLEQATHRLAVSDSFANLYTSAGVDGVATLANGMPPFAPVPPFTPVPDAPPSQGRLRIAHIGGRMVHKGADLVEASFRQGEYQDLELVMIDGAVPAGTTIEAVWGQTPVCLTAPVPPEDIAGLYQSVDVILIPSIWPESYGLVVHEALYFGNWVVVSAIGALPEAVTDGVNGTVLPARDRGAWDSLLADMNANPQRYRRDANRRATVTRTLDDQSAELAEIYRQCRKPLSG